MKMSMYTHGSDKGSGRLLNALHFETTTFNLPLHFVFSIVFCNIMIK